MFPHRIYVPIDQNIVGEVLFFSGKMLAKLCCQCRFWWKWLSLILSFGKNIMIYCILLYMGLCITWYQSCSLKSFKILIKTKAFFTYQLLWKTGGIYGMKFNYSQRDIGAWGEIIFLWLHNFMSIIFKMKLFKTTYFCHMD